MGFRAFRGPFVPSWCTTTWGKRFSSSSRSQATACGWVACLALADLGLIDEYEFLVHPVPAGHVRTLLAGLRECIQIELVDRHEFRSGAIALRCRPRRVSA
jgi:hypothetical protein